MFSGINVEEKKKNFFMRTTFFKRKMRGKRCDLLNLVLQERKDLTSFDLKAFHKSDLICLLEEGKIPNKKRPTKSKSIKLTD